MTGEARAARLLREIRGLIDLNATDAQVIAVMVRQMDAWFSQIRRAEVIGERYEAEKKRREVERGGDRSRDALARHVERTLK